MSLVALSYLVVTPLFACLLLSTPEHDVAMMMFASLLVVAVSVSRPCQQAAISPARETSRGWSAGRGERSIPTRVCLFGQQQGIETAPYDAEGAKE